MQSRLSYAVKHVIFSYSLRLSQEYQRALRYAYSNGFADLTRCFTGHTSF